MSLAKSTQEKLFTAGYATKGVLYLLIGGFALATVIGAARNTNGPKEVISWVGTNPFGQVLLFLMGAGLAAYAGWRWYTAIADTEAVGDDTKGTIKRIGWAVSGTAYGLLAVFAFTSLTNGSTASGSGKKDMIGMLLEQPFGQVLVGIIGAIVAGVGIYQLYRGITDKHMEGIDDNRLEEEKRKTFRYAGRLGLAARFVVYGVIAYFLFRAATMSDASQFRGIGEALSTLRGGEWGTALLAATGAGMLAYGFFMLVRAKYERV